MIQVDFYLALYRTCVQYKAIYILLPEIKTWNLKNITTQATHHQATHALARIQRSHVLQFIESWNLLLEILHILWKLYIFGSAALCICQNTQSQHYYSEILSNPIWLMHWTFQRQWIFPVFFFSFQFYIGFNDPSFLSKESQQLYEIWWFATTLILIRLELGISMTFRFGCQGTPSHWLHSTLLQSS